MSRLSRLILTQPAFFTRISTDGSMEGGRVAKNSTVVFRNRVSSGGMPSLPCYPETVYLAVGHDKQVTSGREVGVLVKS